MQGNVIWEVGTEFLIVTIFINYSYNSNWLQN